LKYFLDSAKANSPILNKSANELKIKGLDLQQIENSFKKPQIAFESGVLLAPIFVHDNNKTGFEIVSQSADNYYGYDLGLSNGGQFSALVTLQQPITFKSQIDAYRENAGIIQQVNQNQFIINSHELEQLVTSQYIICLISKIQADNTLSLLKILNEQLEIMQKLVQSSIYKHSDLLLLQIEQQDFKMNLSSQMSDYRTNLLDLYSLCGIKDTTIVDIQNIDLQISADTVIVSNYYKSFKLDSLRVVSDLKIFEQNYKPHLSFFADAGLNASYLPTPNRLGFSCGITLKIPIYDGNQLKIEREKSLINIQSIEYDKINFQIQQTNNKLKILNQIDNLTENLSIVDSQLISYGKLVEIYGKEINFGDVSIMDYKNLFKDINAKKQEKLMLEMQKQQLINLYNYWNF
jgi:outer membrane protein TolC